MAYVSDSFYPGFNIYSYHMSTASVSKVPRVQKTPKKRHRSPSNGHSKVMLDTCLADAEMFANAAVNFREAGNLEETLAHYLLAVSSNHHALTFAPNSSKTTHPIEAKTQQWLHCVDTLHQCLQSKKDHFHGCLDDEDTAPSDSNTAEQPTVQLGCENVVSIQTDLNPIRLSSIVGHEAIKQDILGGIVQPFLHPMLFKVRRSFLFYGPPGTGKTLFAKASAHSLQSISPNLDVLFYAPTADQLKDKFVGGTEKKISTYFRCVEDAAKRKEEEMRRTKSDTHSVLGIIFFDEFDSLARARDQDDASGTHASATNTLLQMMDGFTSLPHVVVMAATNYPWQLDDAILSRFQTKIYVRLPDQATVARLIQYYLLDHWHTALGLPDVSILANRGPDELERRFELYSRLCDFTSDKLNLVARSLFAPLTYSPSNIKDVCNLVMRKSANIAHSHGVFHKIVTQLKHKAAKSLLAYERELLAHCHGKYACTLTYERLRSMYPNLIQASPSIHLMGHSSEIRPVSIDIMDTHYKCVSDIMLNESHAYQPIVHALRHFTDMHVYIDEKVTTMTSKGHSLHFALYQKTTVQLSSIPGQSVHNLHVVASGTLSLKTQDTLIQYAEAGVLDLQSFMQKLTKGSGQQQLLREAHTIYLQAIHGYNSENDYVQCTIPKDCKILSNHWGEGRAVGTLTSPLAIQQLSHNKGITINKMATQLFAWLLNLGKAAYGNKDAERKTRNHIQLKNVESNHKIVFHGTSHDGSLSNAQLLENIFTLDVRTDSFCEATDASKFKNAIRPSSTSKDLNKFEHYVKTGEVSKS